MLTIKRSRWPFNRPADRRLAVELLGYTLHLRDDGLYELHDAHGVAIWEDSVWRDLTDEETVWALSCPHFHDDEWHSHPGAFHLLVATLALRGWTFDLLLVDDHWRAEVWTPQDWLTVGEGLTQRAAVVQALDDLLASGGPFGDDKKKTSGT